MATTTTIRGLGSVPAAYRHGPKLATPADELRLPGARLKWYDVAPAHAPVSPALQDEARAFLLAESAAGRLPFDDELGFVLLHRCGATFHFLLVQTWRGSNEVWETVYQRD